MRRWRDQPPVPLSLEEKMVRHALAAFCALSFAATGDEALTRAEVDRRIESWQPRAFEKVFDTIGWAPSLAEARRLAAKHNRLVFLFTYDGASMSGFRC